MRTGTPSALSSRVWIDASGGGDCAAIPATRSLNCWIICSAEPTTMGRCPRTFSYCVECGHYMYILRTMSVTYLEPFRRVTFRRWSCHCD